VFIIHSAATHAEVDAMPLGSVAAAAMRGATSTILGGSASSIAIFARSGSSAHPGAPDRKSSSARSSAGTSRRVLAFIWLPFLLGCRVPSQDKSPRTLVLASSCQRLHGRLPLNEVGGFFGDHDGGCVGVTADDGGHHGCVDDTQPIDAAHFQLRVNDGVFVDAHPARSDSVVLGLPPTFRVFADRC